MKNIVMGSISSGTMRNEDLIPCFTEELLWYDPQNSIGLEIQEKIESDDYNFTSDNASYDLESLFDELNNLESLQNLPGFYFGSHPGDGSDYGFWLSESFEYEFDGLNVNDLNDIPSDYNGDALFVNDHGNTTLYSITNGELTEVWSIV